MRDNLDDDKREQIRDNDKNKKYQHEEIKDERKLVKFQIYYSEAPTDICDVCQKFEF